MYIGTGGVILSVTLLTYQHYNQAQVHERVKPKVVTVVKNNDTPDNICLTNSKWKPSFRLVQPAGATDGAVLADVQVR